MPTPVFKFATAVGGATILKHNSIFITSPLDLNDPFEMRPAWTQAHQENWEKDVKAGNEIVANFPVFIATKEGLQPTGIKMGNLPPTKPMDVTHQRGIADTHNGEVFKYLHLNFRVLSFVKELFAVTDNGGESKETDTLMWAHYADQFQGVCLILDSEKFTNGMQVGGYPIRYLPPSERPGLSPSDYNLWQNIQNENPSIPWQEGNLTSNLIQRSLDILTCKSPVWSYEKELRMIYHYPEIKNDKAYKKIDKACLDCIRENVPLEKCGLPNYRDAIEFPSEAVLGVVFGTDCPEVYVAEVLSALNSPRYDHVKTYWSCLSSHLYQVQYMEMPRETIKIYQREHTKRIAHAKSHWWANEKTDGLQCHKHAATKGITYTPPPRQI